MPHFARGMKSHATASSKTCGNNSILVNLGDPAQDQALLCAFMLTRLEIELNPNLYPVAQHVGCDWDRTGTSCTRRVLPYCRGFKAKKVYPQQFRGGDGYKDGYGTQLYCSAC